MSVIQADIALLISENYFSFMIICGLLILMYAYRDVHLPASRNYRLIVLVLLFMSIANSVDCWAALSVDRVNIRFAASLAHYILQPLVIYLELLTIIPDSKCADKAYRFMLAVPAVINAVIYLLSPLKPGLVIWFSQSNSFHRTPLGCTVYIVTFYYLILLLLWSVRFFRQNNYRISVILQFMVGIAVVTAVFEFFIY